MKRALEQLLNALDKVFETDGEVGDTAVREAMREAVHKSFIVPQKGYVLLPISRCSRPRATRK